MNPSMQNNLPVDEASWTILKLLSWTTGYFSSRGIEHPRADAEILLAYTLGLRRIDLYVQYDKPLTRPELTRFRESIQRRVRREPVAYITGEKEFWSLGLKVSPAVLIPRPETECLVEAALSVLSANTGKDSRRILELGTGSGAVILALAMERPEDILYATDRSGKVLVAAQDNAERHGVSGRISFLCGDWFAPIDRRVNRFDLILSNPPYIRRKEIPNLQPEIFRFEPHTALDGGPDGVDSLGHIIAAAPPYLRSGGCLLLEIGHDQRPLLERAIEQTGGYQEPVFIKDYSGHDRVLRLQKKL